MMKRWLRGKQALNQLVDGAVALTGSRFESVTICDGHSSPGIANKSSLLQSARRYRYASALNTQHHCEEFVCDREAVGSCAVMRYQKPTAAALFQRVQSVAGSRLRDLADHQMVIPVKNELKASVSPHFGTEDFGAATKRGAGYLDNAFKGCALNAEKSG